MSFDSIVEAAGKGVDIAGVAAILIGAVIATGMFVGDLRREADALMAYRRRLARAILLGLEFLVAADIIRTVAISPTFAGVGILAVIVLIRTFLSFALQYEVEGRIGGRPAAPRGSGG